MTDAHKKAIIVVFATLFLLLTLATGFVAFQIKHVAVTSILMVALIIIAMDIRWVMRNRHISEL